ncbi:MAG TPA: hypothetical protein C5S37_10410 [Methanophagales archaeon]|nr:hypothetical protein [Methanophagales archaeon]
MKWKREVAAITLLILVLLLLSSVSGASGVRHQRYSEANASDEGIHSFFTDVLGDAGTCMDKFINESADADKFASSLESELKVTEEESRLYATKGIESNVSRVLTPFSPLSGGVKKITLYQTVFLTSYAILKNESDYEAYLRARTAVVNMRTGADEINASLDEIELIELRNETSKIIFNVSEQREKLKDVYALIDRYEQLLEEYEFEAPAFEEYLFTVVVSDEQPFLYEEIRIHVYTKNVTALSLFIDNVTHELKNQTLGEQTKKHRFDVPGEHEIYAEGVTTGEGKNIISSNIVKVYVDKIPTFVSLSSKYAAFVNERVKITGLLVDCYNEPLDGANVTVKIGGEEEELTTDREGYFRFYGTKSSEGVLNVSALYPGNDTYKSSRANISIFFSRLPVSLHIEANKTHINVNETVNFAGSVRGIGSNYSVSLIIFVNDTRAKTLTAAKDFDFSLCFSNLGTYEVYVFSPGDSQFKPAKSNVVKIVVKEVFVNKEIITKQVFDNPRFNTFFYLLLILVAIVSFFIGLHARTLKRKLHALGERLHIPPCFSFSRLHSRTPKVKIHALGSKLHVFKDKILTPMALLFASLYTRTLKGKIHTLREKLHVFIEKTFAPIASIFAVIYARAFKGKFHAFSKSKNKLQALLEKKRAELKNKAAKNPGIEAAVEEVEKEEEQYEAVSEVNILEGVDFEDAYKLLFDTIVAKYRLKRSFTPRELTEKLKEEAFAEKLEKVTELHEKRVFGNVELSDEEGETYFRWIKDILGAC